jgi:hypothetical protein
MKFRFLPFRREIVSADATKFRVLEVLPQQVAPIDTYFISS